MKDDDFIFVLSVAGIALVVIIVLGTMLMRSDQLAGPFREPSQVSLTLKVP